MASGSISSSPRRVVAVSRDQEFLLRVQTQVKALGLEVTCNSGPRQAVNDFLTHNTASLIIDLRILAPGCLKMLSLARREGIVMLGIGPLPLGMKSDQLGGLILVGFNDLGQALAERSENENKPTESAPPPVERQQDNECQDHQMNDLLSPEEISALLECDQ
ncbi:MAG TPA: hypothetical protein ENL03_05895 [Phycisphaerae bacterium]|nr:hypothetical protein [Phycisphaerae bacterium]